MVRFHTQTRRIRPTVKVTVQKVLETGLMTAAKKIETVRSRGGMVGRQRNDIGAAN